MSNDHNPEAWQESEVSNDHSPEQGFERAWQEWAERPPQRSAAIAARRISAHIRDRRHRHRWRWFGVAATAAVLVLAVLAGSWYLRGPEPILLAATQLQATSLGDGEILIWLDDTTPLYMTFQVPETDHDQGGDS